MFGGQSPPLGKVRLWYPCSQYIAIATMLVGYFIFLGMIETQEYQDLVPQFSSSLFLVFFILSKKSTLVIKSYYFDV